MTSTKQRVSPEERLLLSGHLAKCCYVFTEVERSYCTAKVRAHCSSEGGVNTDTRKPPHEEHLCIFPK